ncbi:MAG TPA: cytosine permease, partial [Nitrososphaera sp.]|nr:cytosine permease [Nitrososphaera sp.]
TSAIIIISLSASTDFASLVASPGKGMSFFSALDLVIAMPISWLPLAADYNRFARRSRSALWGTFLGFTITNALFYFGGVLIGEWDVISIILAIQVMFFGFLMLTLLIVDEADNAFADVYSAAVSAQNIFSKLGQKHLVVGLTVISVFLAMVVVSIQQYEEFLLLIGAIFVPLFGVVLTDYYIVNKQRYTEEMFYSSQNKFGIKVPAITAWALGSIINYMLSPLSPLYIPQLPAIGAAIPSLAAASLIYLVILKIWSPAKAVRKT